MLEILTYLIIIAIAFLAVQVFQNPGYALAICWSMLAVESVLQQGNSFLIQRSSLINISVAGLTAIAAVWVVLNRRLSKTKIPLSLILYTGLMLLAFCSILWSLDSGWAWIEIKRALPYILTYCVVAPLCAFDENQLMKTISASIYFGGLVLIAIVISERTRRGIYLTTIGGVDQQANPLANASYAGVVTICALFSIYHKRSNLVLLFLKLAIAGLGVYAIVKSGSRGQLVAVVASCFIWLPVTARLAAKRSTIIALAVSFVAILGAIYLIDESQWSTRWQWEKIEEASHGRFGAVFGMLNAYWDAGGLQLLTGLGNSSSYQIVGFYPHNVPVEVLTEEGLIGFALLSVIVVMTFLKGLQLMGSKNLSSDSRVQLGILLSIATFLSILSLKQGSLWGSSNMFSCYITLGWFYGWLQVAGQKSDSKRQNYMMVPQLPVAPNVHTVR